MASTNRNSKILVSSDEEESVREPTIKKKIPIKKSTSEDQEWAKDSMQSLIKSQNTSFTAVLKNLMQKGFLIPDLFSIKEVNWKFLTAFNLNTTRVTTLRISSWEIPPMKSKRSLRSSYIKNWKLPAFKQIFYCLTTNYARNCKGGTSI